MANTEIKYVKNKINQLENDIAAFARILIDAGIVEIEMEDGKFNYKVHKAKLDDESIVQQS